MHRFDCIMKEDLKLNCALAYMTLTWWYWLLKSCCVAMQLD